MTTMSDLVDKLKKDFSKELGNDFSHLTVRQGEFQDGRTLRGKQWPLRTSQQLRKGEAIELLFFDPNFRRAEVFCRYKGCSMTNNDPAALARYGSGKRDLYLCPEHRDELTREINEMCMKKGVILTAEGRDKTKSEVKDMREIQKVILTPSHQSEGLSNYIQLIPLLEKIYLEATKGRALVGARRKLAQEAVLNVRNFLIITNAVLNPNDENLRLVLPPVLEILIAILADKEGNGNLLLLLYGVIEKILFHFGVRYNRLQHCLNPGALIGAGVGGTLGVIGGVPFGALIAVGSGAGGAVLGGMIGHIIYILFNRRHEHDFEFEGNDLGDLTMRIGHIEVFDAI